MSSEIQKTPESVIEVGEIPLSIEIFAAENVDPDRIAAVIGGTVERYPHDGSSIIRHWRGILGLGIPYCERGKKEKIGFYGIDIEEWGVYLGRLDFDFSAVVFRNSNKTIDLVALPKFTPEHPNGLVTWQTIDRTPHGEASGEHSEQLRNNPALRPEIKTAAYLALRLYNAAPPLERKRATRQCFTHLLRNRAPNIAYSK